MINPIYKSIGRTINAITPRNSKKIVELICFYEVGKQKIFTCISRKVNGIVWAMRIK